MVLCHLGDVVRPYPVAAPYIADIKAVEKICISEKVSPQLISFFILGKARYVC